MLLILVLTEQLLSLPLLLTFLKLTACMLWFFLHPFEGTMDSFHWVIFHHQLCSQLLPACEDHPLETPLLLVFSVIQNKISGSCSQGELGSLSSLLAVAVSLVKKQVIFRLLLWMILPIAHPGLAVQALKLVADFPYESTCMLVPSATTWRLLAARQPGSQGKGFNMFCQSLSLICSYRASLLY